MFSSAAVCTRLTPCLKVNTVCFAFMETSSFDWTLTLTCNHWAIVDLPFQIPTTSTFLKLFLKLWNIWQASWYLVSLHIMHKCPALDPPVSLETLNWQARPRCIEAKWNTIEEQKAISSPLLRLYYATKPEWAPPNYREFVLAQIEKNTTRSSWETKVTMLDSSVCDGTKNRESLWSSWRTAQKKSLKQIGSNLLFEMVLFFVMNTSISILM